MLPTPTLAADLADRASAAIAAQPKPVSFSGLAKLLKAREDSLTEALSIAIDSGRIHRWPDFRRSKYFWHISPDAKAREEILNAAAACALSKALLVKAAKKRLPGFSEQRLVALIPGLLAEKQLQQVRGFAGSAKLLIRPGAREAYLNAARAYIEERIRKAGFDPAGFAETASPQSEAAAPDATEALLAAVRTLEPVSGVPVSTLRLRKHLANLAKPEFDRAALELRRRQAVFLIVHSDTFNLSPEDKDLLIDGQDGNFYVAIAIR